MCETALERILSIDCMAFNALFQKYFRYIAAVSAPIHAFLELIIKTMDSGEREVNPVPITIIKVKENSIYRNII